MEAKQLAASHDEHNSEEGAPNSTSVPDPTVKAHIFREDSEGRVLGKLYLPRPTDDPNDPLTWPVWRKHMVLCSTCFFVFLSNYVTVSYSPILVPLITTFNIDITRGSWLLTFNLLFLGIGNLFWIPLSYKIGKRPVLVLSALVFFVSSIWAAVSRSYGSLLAARIFQGFGASSCEALGPANVADLYFLHERGLWIGFYILTFTVGSSLGGIFAGLIANSTPEWQWVNWMNVILTGVLLVTQLLFQAETNFRRPIECETGEGIDPNELAIIRARTNSSWMRSLSFTSWYDKETSIWWLWWRPWLTLQFPAVVWASLIYGVTLGWLGLQQTANSGVFPAIYNFSALGVGNINISYIIAAFIGCTIGGPVSDWVVGSITKRRGGFFVPEFRLWCIIPPAIFAPIGLMLWGCGLANMLPPMVPIAGTAVTYGVLCAVPTTAMTYVVDSYRPLAGETMTILNAFKNTFAFGLSFGVFPWLERDGFVRVSGWNLLIEGLIFLTTIPMYIYGARIREWTADRVK